MTKTDTCMSTQVEDTLFNVHRYFLKRESPVFRDMFTLTPDAPEGSSDEHPIRLESDVVTVREFERIMFFILGTQYATNTVGTLHRH